MICFAPSVARPLAPQIVKFMQIASKGMGAGTHVEFEALVLQDQFLESPGIMHHPMYICCAFGVPINIDFTLAGCCCGCSGICQTLESK